MNPPLPEAPRGVVFDFAGTLFDDTGVLDPGRVVAKAAGRGILLDEDEASAIIGRTLRVIDAPERAAERAGSDLSTEAHRRVFTRLISDAEPGGPVLVEVLYDCLVDNDAWQPYPDTGPVLVALRRAGIRVGVLSNIGWDIRSAIARAIDPASLDALVLSWEVGLEKPDPAIFAVACDRLGVVPSEVLYVGDDPVKDGAAVRAGLPVYLLPAERAGSRPRGLGAVLRLVGVDGGLAPAGA